MEQVLSRTIHDWQTVRTQLQERLGRAVFESWIRPLAVAGRADTRVILSLPSDFHRKWILSHYLDHLRTSWLETDRTVTKLDFVIVKDSSTTESGNGIAARAESTSKHVAGSPLEEQRRFENFVVGASNKVAEAAARRVAESPQSSMNPLFFSGGVGLGKTHLMHAIAWHIRDEGKRKAVYLSAERFTTEFVNAIRFRNVDAFKEKYRSVDVLMVDDIQFIGGKTQTQEEFFYTFDTLASVGKQIVVSGDRAPVNLENVDERLRSRLGSGLVAELGATTYELRKGILESKVEEAKGLVDPEVVEFLAQRITNDIRELTGALTRIVSHAELAGQAVTIDMARDILRDLLHANARRVTVDDIQSCTAEHYGILKRELNSRRRSRAVARPRQVAIWLCKQLTSMSLPEIGRRFDRDHTTVIHAIRQINRFREDPIFAEEVDLLRRQIEG